MGKEDLQVFLAFFVPFPFFFLLYRYREILKEERNGDRNHAEKRQRKNCKADFIRMPKHIFIGERIFDCMYISVCMCVSDCMCKFLSTDKFLLVCPFLSVGKFLSAWAGEYTGAAGCRGNGAACVIDAGMGRETV